MGCCSSRPRGAQHEQSAVSAVQHPVSSSHALTPPILRDPSRPASSSVSVATSSDLRSPVPLDEHYNAPLRPHAWETKSHRRPWKRSRWLKVREEFFDTRVTNRAEIWGSLKAVVELLDQGDVKTAQGILDASEITLPTGDLVDGAYDPLGNLYQLPPYAVSAPTNMVDDDDEAPKKETATSKTSMYQTLDPGVAGQSEKGKEVAGSEKDTSTSTDKIEIKARLSDRGGPGQDVVVSIGKNDPAKVLMAAVAAKAGLGKDKVRIAYMGKVLKPNKGVLAQGWQSGHVVNALVAP